MPLLDHFYDPVKRRLPFSTLHSGWATYLATNLVKQWLPAPYLAVEHSNHGKVEIDIVTYDTGTAHPTSSGNGGGIVTLPKTWTVPAALCTVPMRFPDLFEVRVYADSSGWELVGAIEFVSPGNKDRAKERRALVAKCASYLHEGISVALIDIVTCHRFNLHNDLLKFLGIATGKLPKDEILYASAYRPVTREGRPEMEVWANACTVGSPLPTMPLRMIGDLIVPIEFESTYTQICEARRLV